MLQITFFSNDFITINTLKQAILKKGQLTQGARDDRLQVAELFNDYGMRIRKAKKLKVTPQVIFKRSITRKVYTHRAQKPVLC